MVNKAVYDLALAVPHTSFPTLLTLVQPTLGTKVSLQFLKHCVHAFFKAIVFAFPSAWTQLTPTLHPYLCSVATT